MHSLALYYSCKQTPIYFFVDTLTVDVSIKVLTTASFGVESVSLR